MLCTVSGWPALRARINSAGKSSARTGPSDVHAQFVSRANMPSKFAWRGLISRADSKCRRRYASAASAGGVLKSGMTVSMIEVVTWRIASGAGACKSDIGRGLSPRVGAGYQTSRLRPAAVVCRPIPLAGLVR